MSRVAINGLGRIGRAVLKIVVDVPELELVAINDVVSAQNLAYLIANDSVYGRYARSVRAEDATLVIDDRRCRALVERDPARLPWRELNVDIVFECTGHFARREDLSKHIDAGAKNVILSAPSKSEDVETIVHAVNRPRGGAQIVSCASCTTNCITPVVEVVGRRIGFTKAVMTTVHAYTATQALVDASSKSFRRGRAGAMNIVPTSTGAAVATTKALPSYKGVFDGVALRVPVAVGSIADMTFVAKRRTSVDEINRVLTDESKGERYDGVLGVSDAPLVSTDIIGDSRASIVDLALTNVIDGDLVKIMSWYDNEWGYASQMVREALEVAGSPTRSVPRSQRA